MLARNVAYITGNSWIFIIGNYVSWLLMLFTLYHANKNKRNAKIKISAIVLALIGLAIADPIYYFPGDIALWLLSMGWLITTTEDTSNVTAKCVGGIVFIQFIATIFTNYWEVNIMQYVFSICLILKGLIDTRKLKLNI